MTAHKTTWILTNVFSNHQQQLYDYIYLSQSLYHQKIKQHRWSQSIQEQTRLFRPLSHYQSLWSREEQDLEFWKEVAIVLVDNKHNTEILWNSYPITMFQGGPLYEPYIIAINNWDQVIIWPNKKTVATYIVGELKMLVWFIGIWMLKTGYCYNWCLMDTTWTRVKGNDDKIGCTIMVSVSALYSRCYTLTSSSCFMTCLLHIQWITVSFLICIYSIDTFLYPYALPLVYHFFTFSSLCLSAT